MLFLLMLFWRLEMFEAQYVNPCDSNPCQNFGICYDFNISKYYCTCVDGYSPFDPTLCLDIDECRVSPGPPCGKYGCINRNGSYSCICPSYQAGQNCEINRTISETSIHFSSLWPNTGIVSGGGVVNVYGEFLNFYTPLSVLLRPFGRDEIFLAKIIKNDSTRIQFKTPRVPSKYVGALLQVSIVYFQTNETSPLPSDYVDTNLTFSYQHNPTLNDVYPKILLADGGVTIYAYGTGFLGVTNIYLFAYLQMVDSQNTFYNYNYQEKCIILNDTTISCVFPNLNITQKLIPVYTGGPAAPTITTIPPRKKRSSLLTELYMDDIPVSNPYFQDYFIYLYMGFKMDEFYGYRRSGLALPKLKINLVFRKPQFVADFDNLIIIKSMEDLKITGEDVNVGCTAVDYRVMLGNGTCLVDHIESNLLDCRPPVGKPSDDRSDNSFRYCRRWPGSLILQVFLGRNTAWYVIGCVDYASSKTTNTNLIIGLTIGLIGSFLLILVIVALCCYRRKGDLKNKRSSNALAEMTPNYIRTIDEEENRPNYSRSIEADEEENRPNYSRSIEADEEENRPNYSRSIEVDNSTEPH